MSLGIPFPNPKPLGWGLFEVLTSSQMTQVNANAAAAADGAYWTDLAPLKNWNYQQITGAPTTMTGKSLIYDPTTRRWLVFGITSEACVIFSYQGTRWFGPYYLSGSPLLNALGAAAVNNAGVILAGGTPASATIAKLRSSVDGGVTWTPRNIGNSNTLAVPAIGYSESLGLWLAVVGGSATHDGLYTSPDLVTWTNRYSATSPGFFCFRDTPSTVILATALAWIPGDPTGYIRSTDGITWTASTFPDSVSNQVCWSTYWGKFFVAGTTGIWTSPDGTTGSWTKINATETNAVNISARGRMLLKGDAKASVDGGGTWITIADTTDVDLFVNVAANGAGMARGASRDLYISQQVGT